MCCALVYCLVVDLTISVLVPVGLLFHDVELDVGGKAAKGFPEQQCLGAEARRGGFVKWLPCWSGLVWFVVDATVDTHLLLRTARQPLHKATATSLGTQALLLWKALRSLHPPP